MAPVRIDARGEARLLAKETGQNLDDIMQMLEKLARFGQVAYDLCVNVLLVGNSRDFPIATLLGKEASPARLAREQALLCVMAARSAEELAQTLHG